MGARPLLAFLLPALAGACFSYPYRTAGARAAFAEGRFEQALERFPADADGPDRMLLALEHGLIAHTAGDYEASLREFEGALDALASFEERPTVSGRSLLEGAASWIGNDTTLPYDGEGFERVLLHTFLALDYLFLGRLEDARVELKRADAVAKEEEERYGTRYPGQNAFARFVSGVVYEGLGDLEDAFLDYRAAREANRDAPLLARDLLRVAQALGRSEEVERLRAEVPGIEAGVDPEAGEIVCFLAAGLGPIKEPIEIPVPTVHTATKIAVPRFVRRGNPVARLRILEGERLLAETDLLEDLEETAIRNLSDRIAWIAAKGVARAAIKGAIGEALAAKRRDEDAALLLGLAAAIFNFATERADLRSWLTLPANFQAARFELPPGRHDLTLQLIGGGGEVLNTRPVEAVEVRPGRRVFLNLRSVDARLFAAVIGGGPGPGAASSPSPEG